MICKECNEFVANGHALRFHLRKHNLTAQQYYDKYLLKENEDRCVIFAQQKTIFMA